jgi:ABC-type sulfate transport system permease component
MHDPIRFLVSVLAALLVAEAAHADVEPLNVAGLFVRSASMSPEQLFTAIGSPRALAAYRLSFGASFAAAGRLKAAREQRA